MLTTVQVNDVINRIRDILNDTNAPYKLLDLMDGNKWGVRWNNLFYVYACDKKGNESNYKHPEKFIYYIGSNSYLYDIGNISELYEEIRKDIEEWNKHEG